MTKPDQNPVDPASNEILPVLGVAASNAEDEGHKSLRGSASQYFVAGELCRRGWVAAITLGNCPNTDILCSDLRGALFVHIQVKTFRVGNTTGTALARTRKQYIVRDFSGFLSACLHRTRMSRQATT